MTLKQGISSDAAKAIDFYARAFGLDRQVLQQTIAEAALDEEAHHHGPPAEAEHALRDWDSPEDVARG